MKKEKNKKMGAEIIDVADTLQKIAKKVKKRKELEIVPSLAKTVEFSEIKGNSNFHNNRKSKDINNWNATDFVLYVKDKYYIKYSKPLELNLISSANEIQKLKDEILENFGYINNIIVKMYIDFFVHKYMDQKIIKKPFYFSQLKEKKYIEFFKVFCSNNIGGEINKHAVFSKSKDISESNLENSFFLDKSILVREYGIVLSVNWLIINKKYSRKKALEIVLYTCIACHKEGTLGDIIGMTNSLSPYPKSFVFQEIDKVNKYLSKQTNKKVDINIKFTENNKFNFIGVNNQ